MASPNPVTEPFPIFTLAHRFLLYDPDTIAHVRSKHNMTGVLIGGLPQAPQQNVFSGVPLELMPEEARLLVEKKVAFVVDDAQSHKQNFLSGSESGLSLEERKAYQASLRKQGQAAANQATKRTDDRRKAALGKLAASGDWNDIPEDMFQSSSRSSSKQSKRKPRAAVISGSTTPAVNTDDEDGLFAAPLPHRPSQSNLSSTAPTTNSAGPEPYPVTPTTSYPPLRNGLQPPPPPPPRSSSPSSTAPPSTSTTPQRVLTPTSSEVTLPDAPQSYPLFKHLHDKGYFLSPGLRFGCQYMAYPGDPLRFHSHFLCSGMGWDDEFPLLDLVGGGRLGTGVKKGYLIGGEETTDKDEQGPVRAFGIEWGGM